jgi:uncharacterized protein (DUF362 family)
MIGSSCSAMSESLESVVTVARSARPEYGGLAQPVPAPELPGGEAHSVACLAVRDLFLAWGLDRERAGSAGWNPLGELIPSGAPVLVKPNWVLHWNQSGQGLDCQITHPSVIEAALEYLALARPGRVVVGDAPIQGCDFAELQRAMGLDGALERFRARGMDVSIRDFRRTVLEGGELGGRREENRANLARYVLFDLKEQSLLEPLTREGGPFRVTMYDPDLLARTHAPGKHEYLIAREAFDAKVVLNLPKLKCHKKACITGALKNLVGINGNKEYLPHHRKGGAAQGGDCYAGSSWLKRQAENVLDAANRRESGAVQAAFARMASNLLRCAVLLGEDDNLEGSWYGNDTVWRMVLDLQRILRYGRTDGTLAETPQRMIISLTDAIVAGEGEGPLAPTPVASGFVTGSLDPAAAEWVHARLMGFDPERIPLVRHAFDAFPFPVAVVQPESIRVRQGRDETGAEYVTPIDGRQFRPPAGWAGHCELAVDAAVRG